MLLAVPCLRSRADFLETTPMTLKTMHADQSEDDSVSARDRFSHIDRATAEDP
jgi:hypothetical protein